MFPWAFFICRSVCVVFECGAPTLAASTWAASRDRPSCQRRKQPTTLHPPVRPPPSEYTVLARRYRPQQFADLVGQEPVAEALINAITSNRVAHAYLFTGARGVGKTSTARILAKALNCVKGPTPTPCDVCDLCKAIAVGEDMDVLEIDGASNRGIDEVREIRQNVQFRPSRSRYKIYIIDEVHMLTGPAFNALLKTLEEPPAHVKFIFATTEAQKIPITILSRCQRFDFTGISVAGVVQRLQEIVASEGMAAAPEALEIIGAAPVVPCVMPSRYSISFSPSAGRTLPPSKSTVSWVRPMKIASLAWPVPC